MRSKTKKGVAPVIATIMLIGVTTIAVGAVYSFTQDKTQVLRSEKPPNSQITLEKAYKDNAPIYCGNTDGAILKNTGGEALEVDKLEFRITTKSQPGASIYRAPAQWEWDPGEVLGISDFDHDDYIFVTLPAERKCSTYHSNQYAPGESVNIEPGEEMTVKVIHEPTNQVIFDGSIEGWKTVESYR